MDNLIFINDGVCNKTRIKGLRAKGVFSKEMTGGGYYSSLQVLEPGNKVEKHIHKDKTEIVYIIKGSGTYLINGEHVPFKAGDSILAPVGNEHEMINNTDEEIEMLCTFIMA